MDNQKTILINLLKKKFGDTYYQYPPSDWFISRILKFEFSCDEFLKNITADTLQKVIDDEISFCWVLFDGYSVKQQKEFDGTLTPPNEKMKLYWLYWGGNGYSPCAACDPLDPPTVPSSFELDTKKD